ncbi:MAG: cobalamin biosynthesis protein CbiX [Candidatus Omnitrophica bacterium]|nr:cobalamin biosynthesis protein CbiX [Candidatus Omnitrophota bacterium]
MDSEGYCDAALILLGHGTVMDADSCAPVYQHASEMRRRRLFGSVREAFWRQLPRMTDVLGETTAPRVFIVPLFMSNGYFVEHAIPIELGLRQPRAPGFSRVQRRGSQTLFYCQPVGTHKSMTSVVLARARDIVVRLPCPNAPPCSETALFVAGHGTDRNEDSRKPIERQVELIRALGQYGEAHAVFLEEEPRIGDCWGMSRCPNLVVVPFFISDGLHVRQDIPALLMGKVPEPHRFTWRNPIIRDGQRLWLTSSVGTDPLIAGVILERVAELVAEDREIREPERG